MRRRPLCSSFRKPSRRVAPVGCQYWCGAATRSGVIATVSLRSGAGMRQCLKPMEDYETPGRPPRGTGRDQGASETPQSTGDYGTPDGGTRRFLAGDYGTQLEFCLGARGLRDTQEGDYGTRPRGTTGHAPNYGTPNGGPSDAEAPITRHPPGDYGTPRRGLGATDGGLRDTERGTTRHPQWGPRDTLIKPN